MANIGRNIAEALRRLEQARYDLEAAQDSHKTNHNEWACFQAQQAAEKALKAYLFAKRQQPFAIHSVGALLELCKEEKLDIAGIKNSIVLDSYYVPARYPNGVPYGTVPHKAFSSEQAKGAIELASRLIDVITKNIGQKT